MTHPLIEQKLDELERFTGAPGEPELISARARQRLRAALTETFQAGARSVKDDLDAIWGKYHINTYENDGHHDSAETVVEKFVAGFGEQVAYFKALSPKEE